MNRSHLIFRDCAAQPTHSKNGIAPRVVEKKHNTMCAPQADCLFFPGYGSELGCGRALLLIHAKTGCNKRASPSPQTVPIRNRRRRIEGEAPRAHVTRLPGCLGGGGAQRMSPHPLFDTFKLVRTMYPPTLLIYIWVAIYKTFYPGWP